MALSMLVINTMLQAKREKRLIDNEAASSELAHSDEFVVLLPNVSKELFDKKIKMLNEKIAENEIPMISVGNSYGSSGQIEKLIDLAEKNMYEEKEKLHKEHPSYSRL